MMTMNRLRYALPLLLASFQLCSAGWVPYHGWGFGASGADPDHEQQFQQFIDANQHPNVTKAIPGIVLGPAHYTFRVNISEFTPTGVDTNIQDPRIVNTVYSLEWTGGESINDTIQYQDKPPRLCAILPLGLFSAQATNNWDPDVTGGDCNSALGSDCYDALIGMSYDWNVDCLSSFNLPQACGSVFPSGGIGSAALTDPSPAYAKKHNLTASERMNYSPFGFAFWTSSMYGAGDTTAFDRETERLHMVMLTSKGTEPICVRVKDDHVSPGGPSSGAQSRWKGNAVLSLLLAAFVALWLT